MKVYLAGPILDCNKGEANDWRAFVAGRLAPHCITGVSPLRCEPLIGERYSMAYPDPKFGTPRAIRSKNFFDVQRCDLTLAFLPTPAPGRHQSYGTIAELNWAFALNKPSILVSDDPGVYEHPVIDGVAGWSLRTLDEAIEVCIGVLSAYVGGKNV